MESHLVCSSPPAIGRWRQRIAPEDFGWSALALGPLLLTTVAWPHERPLLCGLIGVAAVVYGIHTGRLRRLSALDPGSGAGNRAAFAADLTAELVRAHRPHGTSCPVSLILLDLDGFGTYNSRYGHPAGDQVIAQVVRTVADTAGSSCDRIYRTGTGDEFALILPGQGEREALALACSLRAAIAAWAAGSGGCTASLGMATAPVHATEAAGLYAAADRALFYAKGAGGNCVWLCTPALRHRTAKETHRP